MIESQVRSNYEKSMSNRGSRDTLDKGSGPCSLVACSPVFCLDKDPRNYCPRSLAWGQFSRVISCKLSRLPTIRCAARMKQLDPKAGP